MYYLKHLMVRKMVKSCIPNLQKDFETLGFRRECKSPN